MVEIELKSVELKKYVCAKLSKDFKEKIYDSDLLQIKDISLNASDIVGNPTDETIYDLIFFKNLELLYLNNMNITEDQIEILNRLENLKFLQIYNCFFENSKQFKSNIDILVICESSKVKIKELEGLKNIQELKIVNCKKVDISGIEVFAKLQKLYLQNLKMEDIDEILKLPKLKYLNLNGSKIEKMVKIDPSIELVFEKKNYLYV